MNSFPENSKLSCIICGSENPSLLYPLSLYGQLGAGGVPGNIFQCENCGMIFKRIRGNPVTYYDDTYADAVLKNGKYVRSRSTFSLCHTILEHECIQQIMQTSDPVSLDIGCGAGSFLEVVRSCGFDAEGLDVSPMLADKARGKGFRVYVGDVESIELTRKYDLITMIDILEHLPNPVSVMKRLRGYLKANGHLVVYTPNHRSLLVKIADILWNWGIRKPVTDIFGSLHVAFYTPETLQKLLVSSGFLTVHWQVMPYDTRRPGQPVSPVQLAAIRLIETLGMKLQHNGFRMTVYAKKTGKPVYA
ncbi:class I SAM-dependent methyltransferase [bacterium]|nr:class I SAM-dependent methyltransferase [candidate division CSSED10-310 bacterium]